MHPTSTPAAAAATKDPTTGDEAEARRLARAGDVQGAAELYRGVLARAPDNVDALRLLGVALGQLQRLDEADACLRRAVAVASDYVFAWNNLGSILGEMDRTDEAVAAFERTLALNPEQTQS